MTKSLEILIQTDRPGKFISIKAEATDEFIKDCLDIYGIDFNKPVEMQTVKKNRFKKFGKI